MRVVETKGSPPNSFVVPQLRLANGEGPLPAPTLLDHSKAVVPGGMLKEALDLCPSANHSLEVLICKDTISLTKYISCIFPQSI